MAITAILYGIYVCVIFTCRNNTIVAAEAWLRYIAVIEEDIKPCIC